MFLLSKKCCKCDTDALINIKKPAQKIVYYEHQDLFTAKIDIEHISKLLFHF